MTDAGVPAAFARTTYVAQIQFARFPHGQEPDSSATAHCLRLIPIQLLDRGGDRHDDRGPAAALACRTA
jgi:hypothetical protein